MLSVQDLTVQFGKRVLFNEVNLNFVRGNCYGIIGANGAGKSTFLKVLSGELIANRGKASLEPGNRMAVLSQNHFGYEDKEVLEVVKMGYEELYRIEQEKNAIYMNPEATDADGMRAAELENQYGEMGGWTADSDAAELLSNMGIKEDLHYKLMEELTGPEKVKVLLAQALFGNPDILLLDEPTNDLDAHTVHWLADFLADFQNTVIVVSHDRYFLDMVCTHIVDIDRQQATIYTGNYSFWYQSSQLAMQQMQNKNKKMEQKRAEMMEFIQRFSANASKSKQATSRKKALDKLNLEEIKPSSRKYPFIAFQPEREPGDQILKVSNLSKKSPDGTTLFSGVSFTMNGPDKIALVSMDSAAITAFYEILAGITEADSGTIEWGQTIAPQYLPNENNEFFTEEVGQLDLVEWLRQYSQNKDEQFIRGFLGRMLFGGEEVHKNVSVLSGGEKVRCMMSKAMLNHPNFLLLDEPTNHLDLESITALNNALKDFKGNLIMSSHDHELVQTVANRILEIGPGGMVDSLMPYSEYVESDEIEKKREGIYEMVA
ncbi:ATPase subunit of ABC transporter with duplicated ATPase domains [Lewinella aquimaris]|uniref:Probable ATP-binding protein YbiT n=1 Tax=Neolewinella aquimaris TaxID=1835722 RepID=A0A840E1L8_9BACT|nr:ATP-binding cassette domain-containing protein [Neolewinella aquimaris]MBB4079444.1 ATPase subunit of ABC transporter with duplicated ATPase domains [Neolewinella aquimaris]